MALSPSSSRSSSSSGSVTLLSTTTLGADGTMGVSAIAQTATDLHLVLIARGTRAAATVDFLQLQLNGDATANAYDGGVLDNAAASGPNPGTSARMCASLPAATATAGAMGFFCIDIPAYTSSLNPKIVQSVAILPVTKNTTVTIEHSYAVWWNAAAVTRVTLFGGTTANLLAGSTLRIYGVT